MLFSLTVEEAAGGLDGVLLTLLDKTLSLHTLVGGDTQALLIKTRRLVWSWQDYDDYGPKFVGKISRFEGVAVLRPSLKQEIQHLDANPESDF